MYGGCEICRMFTLIHTGSLNLFFCILSFSYLLSPSPSQAVITVQICSSVQRQHDSQFCAWEGHLNFIVLDKLFPVMAISVAIVMGHNQEYRDRVQGEEIKRYVSCVLDMDPLESF